MYENVFSSDREAGNFPRAIRIAALGGARMGRAGQLWGLCDDCGSWEGLISSKEEVMMRRVYKVSTSIELGLMGPRAIGESYKESQQRRCRNSISRVNLCSKQRFHLQEGGGARPSWTGCLDMGTEVE